MNTEQKIDKILETVNAQNVQIATFITHQKQHRKEIDSNTNDIKKLTGLKDRLLGIIITVSGGISIIIGIVGIIYNKH